MDDLEKVFQRGRSADQDDCLAEMRARFPYFRGRTCFELHVSCSTRVLPQEFFHLPHRPLKILISFSAVVEESMPSFGVFDEVRLSSDCGEALLEIMNQLGRNQ